MKTIYKSIALEAALLSVTLALQAEIQSEGETVTADVQASTLDRLKVTLVSPNVSGARDLVASGNATINGNEIAVNLENLTFGTHRLVVSARFGTQIRTLYALDISVPQAELPNETQEYEDAAIVVSTYGDGGGGEFPTDYARQGDDPTATLTDTQAYAQAASEDAAAAKTAAQAIVIPSDYAKQGANAAATNTAILEKVQQLTSLDADILAGKTALATNISTKGVPSSISDALTVMATKVLQIPQQINTRTSEFEQMIAPSPYMWNVYTVATDLMKQELPAYIPSYMAGGNYEQYRANNAFFVGEYYLGYDTLELTGADGFLTCDGDFYVITGEAGSRIVTHTAPDGTVETYAAESIIHTWHDGASGYCNRWVGFFYLTNAYSFTNTTSSICPRRVAICGDCLSFVVSGDNRLTDAWVIGTLSDLQGGSSGGSWSRSQIIANYEEKASPGSLFYKGTNIYSVCLPDMTRISGGYILNFDSNSSDISHVISISLPELREITSGVILYAGSTAAISVFETLSYLGLPKLQRISGGVILDSNVYINPNITKLDLPSLEEINGGFLFTLGAGTSIVPMNKLELLNCPNLAICRNGIYKEPYAGSPVGFSSLIDCVVGALTTSLYMKRWNPTNVLADADKTTTLIDNIKNHILERVSDATGGTQLVFTVSTNMYNAIASETITWQDQNMTLADAFLTKNWLLAGA